jgi:DNA-binding protein YbaB
VEDLIKAAHADARAKVDAKTAEEMAKLTGGMQLPPGFKPPF